MSLKDLPFSLDDLELSVRSASVLRLANVTTLDQFVRLTREEVTAFANAGRKTWAEIETMQRWLLQGGVMADVSRARAVVLINHLNATLAQGESLTVVVRDNRVLLVTIDPQIVLHNTPEGNGL